MMNEFTTIKPPKLPVTAPPLLIRAKHLIEYMFIRIFVFILTLMPRRTASMIVKGITLFIYFALPRRRKVAMKNLDIAFGDSLTLAEKSTILKKNFTHIGLSFFDLFTEDVFVKNARENVIFEGAEHALAAFEKGNGMIFVMSHLGSWEYLSFFAHLHGIEQTILGKTLRNSYVNEWIISLRLSAGLKTSSNTSGARMTIKELKHNHLVAIAIDQWGGNSEPWLDFFGTPASTTTLPARAALKMNSALIPGFCLREAPGKYKIVVKPAVPLSIDGHDRSVEDITQDLNNILEEMIRAYPDQWMWTHNRWKGKKLYRVEEDQYNHLTEEL